MTILTIAIVGGVLLAGFFFWSILRVGCLADQAMGIHDGLQLYPMYCPWCEKKGRCTIGGWSTKPDSSAICEPCAIEVFGPYIESRIETQEA